MKVKDKVKNKNITWRKYISLLTCFVLIAAYGTYFISADEFDSTESLVMTELFDNDNFENTDTNENTIPDLNFIPEYYEKIEDNSQAALYANMLSGDFAFQDKASGKIWFSTPADYEYDELTRGIRRTEIRSQIIVGYADLQSEAITAYESIVNSYAGSVSLDAVTVGKIEKGIRVDFEFPDFEFVVPVEYRLEGKNLIAAVLLDEIKENSTVKVMSIQLLPYIMSAGVYDEGYLFVPQGSGAIIRFNNGKHLYTQYESPAYGLDRGVEQSEAPSLSNNIIMPVYGIKKGEYALTGIITKGEEISSVIAGVSGGRAGYNNVGSKATISIIDSTVLFETDYFNLREIFKIEKRKRGISKYEITFISSAGDKSSYTGIAEIYREYLLENGLLKKNPKEPALHVDLLGAINKKATFLGIPYEKLAALTTYAQAADIAREINDSGVDNLVMRLTGWTNNGVKNDKITSSAQLLNVLGGRREYNELVEYTNNADVELIHNVDMINFSKSGNSVSKLRHATQTLFHTRSQQFEFMLSVFVPSLKTEPWYLVKPTEIFRVSDNFAKSFIKFGGENISFDYIGENLYSDFSSKTGITREGSVVEIKKSLENIKDLGLKISVDTGNSYAYPYVDRLFSLPMISNNHLIIDESVPFAQIVLHGYLSYSSENLNRAISATDTFLRCIETGSNPYYQGMHADHFALVDTQYTHFYSSSFNLWKDKAVQNFKEYQEVYTNLYDKQIINHETLEDNVFKTTFSDGTEIVVNYNDYKFIFDGFEVEGKNYYVKGGR